jgi:hypothetical protein
LALRARVRKARLQNNAHIKRTFEDGVSRGQKVAPISTSREGVEVLSNLRLIIPKILEAADFENFSIKTQEWMSKGQYLDRRVQLDLVQ